VLLRPISSADLPELLTVNNAAVPNVNELDAGRFAELVGLAELATVATDGDTLLGFVLAMAEGAGYDSANYLWFSARYPRFLYVDRVIVAETGRGAGTGTALYKAVFDHAGPGVPVTCEVNVRPPNEGSMRFHRRHGFAEVGRQDTEGGTKTVALLAAGLPG
jgi:predicted GNAT superfamily acetyltransferase